MKKLMVLLSIFSGLASCGRGEDKSIPFEDLPWEKISPEEIGDFNPFVTVGRDWMALAMGKDAGMNSMTISWGTAGVLWNRPVFTVFVSKDRHSKGLMDKESYFTVMAFPKTAKNRDGLLYIGSHSKNDDENKSASAGFTVEYTESGNPLFREAGLAFECRIIYRSEFKKDLLPQNVREMYDGMGLHTMYVGEIVNVYRKELPGEAD